MQPWHSGYGMWMSLFSIFWPITTSVPGDLMPFSLSRHRDGLGAAGDARAIRADFLGHGNKCGYRARGGERRQRSCDSEAILVPVACLWLFWLFWLS